MSSARKKPKGSLDLSEAMEKYGIDPAELMALTIADDVPCNRCDEGEVSMKVFTAYHGGRAPKQAAKSATDDADEIITMPCPWCFGTLKKNVGDWPQKMLLRYLDSFLPKAMPVTLDGMEELLPMLSVMHHETDEVKREMTAAIIQWIERRMQAQNQ